MNGTITNEAMISGTCSADTSLPLVAVLRSKFRGQRPQKAQRWYMSKQQPPTQLFLSHKMIFIWISICLIAFISLKWLNLNGGKGCCFIGTLKMQTLSSHQLSYKLQKCLMRSFLSRIKPTGARGCSVS